MNTSDTIKDICGPVKWSPKEIGKPKDLCGSVNPRPKESEKTVEEYEYCKAGTHEEWSTIVDAIFRGDCEIKRSVVKPEGTRGLAVSVVWDRATHIENGREYRWKKPAPPKVKKLVDRTAEELIPLIGRIARKKRDGLYFMITSNQVFDQENMEIAPLGSDDFLPMQKEIEVECE